MNKCKLKLLTTAQVVENDVFFVTKIKSNNLMPIDLEVSPCDLVEIYNMKLSIVKCKMTIASVSQTSIKRESRSMF